MKLYVGDCREIMKDFPDNSIDSIVTDPPYELGFMGKSWDRTGIANDVTVWRECLRVLKPGGHLLAFGGTRTYHRMASAVEDAGFEIRDMVAWIYGSGMPKAFNLRREAICECKEISELSMRSLRETDLSQAINLKDECGEVLQSGMPQSGVSTQGRAGSEREAEGQEQSCMEGRIIYRAGQGIPDDKDAGASTGTKEWLRRGAHSCCGENDGASTGTGRRGSPQESQSRGQSTGEFEGVRQSLRALDGGALSGRGACSRCGKLKKEFEGFSTALKPSHEPLVLARKPLKAKTVAANVLEFGTGAINVDGCRVAADDAEALAKNWNRAAVTDIRCGNYGNGVASGVALTTKAPAGRWPANLIHDGSDEVVALFPANAKTGKGGEAGMGFHGGDGEASIERGYGDTGSAARFFYCAKASKKDRDEGLEAFEEQRTGAMQATADGSMLTGAGNERTTKRRNHHPTVKPTDLMRYLCRLITPPGGVVLDPFMGSGSTGKAAILEGFDFIGIELSSEYVKIAEARIGQ